MKVLMLCLGNICRSPMAEGILRHKAEQAGLNFEIDSCGTGGWHVGESPDRRAQTKMLEKGIDISHLRARQLQPRDFEYFDLVYAMDQNNYADALHIAGAKHKDKVKLVLNELNPNSNQAVPDPYYGSEDGFETVYRLLDNAFDVVINRALNG